MSTLKTGALRGTSGTADSVQLHASDQSVTFPGNVTCSGTATGFGGGKVLQMKYVNVPATNDNEQDVTSTSYTALTKPELTITPAASGNLILVMLDIFFSVGNDDGDVENSLDFQVLRTQSGLTDVAVGSYAHNLTTNASSRASSWLNYAGKINIKAVDTTVNANAITYKCHARLDHQSDTCRFHMGNTYSGSTGSSIIAMEFEP